MASFRQYKAAVMHFLEASAGQGDAVSGEAMEALRAASSAICAKRGRRTSGSKLKRFPPRDYRRVRGWLAEHPSPWAGALMDWLAAGLLTGLRPSEWSDAALSSAQNHHVLVVQNAKATNQRAFGPQRHLILDGLSDAERAGIARHLERARGFAAANDFVRYMHGCAATLTRATRTLWPRRTRYPTLYSTRHQFSADAKASGMGTEEVAALMGHAVDTTAIKHYGRRSAGVDMVRVRPDEADVAKVRHAFRAQPSTPEPVMRPPRPAPRPPGEDR